MLSDIAELQILSWQCHCTDEINALRNALEQKIGNIPIRTYRDEVTALNAQINIIANDMTAIRQELNHKLTMINNQVTDATTSTAFHADFKKRLEAL